MFAIAIFDAEKQKLYCIRDQVGQKQMFYSVINGEFVCSGDINEIVATEGFEKKLNLRKLPDYLCFEYIPTDDTLFKDVYKLAPGTCFEYKDGKTILHGGADPRRDGKALGW